jgi:hypothetical protein
MLHAGKPKGGFYTYADKHFAPSATLNIPWNWAGYGYALI